MSGIVLGVLASGKGSNCAAIQQAIEEHKLDARIGVIITNNPQAGVLELARQKDLPCSVITSDQFETREAFYDAFIGTLRRNDAQLIVLAGYLKKVGRPLLQAFPHRVLNIHPALLPAFGGKGMFGHHVHRAVIEYGAKITGVTVHLVDEEYDHGPVVLQRAIPVLETDTTDSLAKRVLTLEHDTYFRAIQLFAENRVQVHGRKVFVRNN